MHIDIAIQKVNSPVWSGDEEDDYEESVVEEEEEEEEVVSVIESSVAEPIIEEPDSETVSQMEVHIHTQHIFTQTSVLDHFLSRLIFPSLPR